MNKELLSLYPNGLRQVNTLAMETEEWLKNLVPDSIHYTLVAVGGLGRKEQGFYSDLDLLFIIPSISYQEEPMELLKILWDKNIKVGYSIRTMDNIFIHAKEDITFFTTLIFSRFLRGDEVLYRLFEEKKKKFYKENRSIFFSSFYPEIQKISFIEKERNILLNQPPLKNHFGGLRGFQMIEWFIALYPEYGHLKNSSSYKKATQYYSFLWAVRNLASFLAGRSVDNLSFDILEKIAKHFQWEKTFQIEKFLQKIFRAFSSIYDLSLELKEEMSKNLPSRKKIFQFFRKKDNQSSITVVNKKIYVKEESTLSYLSATLYAIKTELVLADETIRKAKVFFKNKKEWSEEEKNCFQQFFYLEEKIYEAFYYLHLIGFLGNFIPLYKRMIFKPQLDFYHTFTLSEHSLLTLKYLSNYYSNTRSPFFQILKEITQEEKEALIYALILHDIGKIEEGDHITNNIQLIDGILESLPLSEKQKQIVSFLVIHHLAMSSVYQVKDIHRIKTILEFATKIQNKTFLKLLTLLTACDAQAVNNNPLPSFIESSLLTLYFKTSVVLSSDKYDIEILAEEKKQIIQGLEKELGLVKETIFSLFPEEYLIEIEPKEIAKDIELIKKNEPIIDITKEKDIIRVKIFRPDEEGLLCKIVAGISLSQLNILEAKVYTLTNGMALDYFYCESLLKDFVLEEFSIKEIQNQITLSLHSGQDTPFQVFYNKFYYWMSKTNLVSVKTQIKIHTIEENSYYLSISARDFPGILYFITLFLKKMGFSITKARINTIGVRIYDGFYLKHKTQNLNLQIIEKDLEEYIENMKKQFHLN